MLGSTQRALLVPPISSSVGTDAVSDRGKCVTKSTTAGTEQTSSHTTTVVSGYLTARHCMAMRTRRDIVNVQAGFAVNGELFVYTGSTCGAFCPARRSALQRGQL